MKFIEAITPLEKEIVISFKASELKFIADVFGGLSINDCKKAHSHSSHRLTGTEFDKINTGKFQNTLISLVEKHA